MTVIWVRPKAMSYGVGPNGERTYRRSYLVLTDDPNELKRNILLCGALPVYGAPYPEDPLAWCQRVDPKQRTDSPLHWEVEAEWSSQYPGGNPTDRQKPPDQRRPQWDYKFQPLHKIFPTDLDGVAFCDSAGTPFDPPPEIPLFVDQITVRRYEQSFSRKADRKYLNATNTDAWQDAQAGEALVQTIDRQEVFEDGAYWFSTTYVVLCSPLVTISGVIGPSGDSPTIGGWDPVFILDQGPKILDANNKPQAIIDSAQAIDGRPQLLDGSGHVIARGGDPHYLKFRTVNKIAFSGLNLTPPWHTGN